MPCTYYGGSTARFARNVLQGLEECAQTLGTHQSFRFVKESPYNRKFDTLLFTSDDQVLSNQLGGFSPLFISLENCEGAGPGGPRSKVNLDFLAQCKLLDMTTYRATLKGYASPLALKAGLSAAKKVTKPDFPRNRSYGPDAADFLEALIYCQLVPEEMPGTYEQAYRFGSFGIWTQYCRKSQTALRGVEEELVLRPSHDYFTFTQVRSELHGEIRVHGLPTLNLKSMARLGLLDLVIYDTLTTMYPRIEALQQAIRTKLHYYTQSQTDTVELPAAFNAEY